MKIGGVDVRWIAAGAALVVVVIAAGKLRAVAENPAGAGEAVGATAGAAIAGAAGGVILGVGDGLGLDRTNMSQCEKDKANGNTWDASFSCPAGDFISYWWNK